MPQVAMVHNRYMALQRAPNSQPKWTKSSYKHIALLADFDPLALGRAGLAEARRPVTGWQHRAVVPAMDLGGRDF